MAGSRSKHGVKLQTRREWLAVSVAATASQPMTLAGAEDAMVLIPEGPFLMGTTAAEAALLARKYRYHASWLAGEAPQRKIELAAFQIDKYPVTNRDYAAFVSATGYTPPRHWSGSEPPAGILEHPVTFVNRADANAYAKWAGKRLPASAEWEKAARGADGRLFPWGRDFDPEACQYDAGAAGPPAGTAPAGSHPRGRSPYGVMDMAGNVAEWCDDGPGPGSAYLKGGCWLSASPLMLRCAALGMSGFDNNRLDYIGFRCVKGE